MKCEHCGADLSIENAKCPYCGLDNPYYKQHREQMQQYQKEFQNTKKDVYQVTNRYVGKTIYITIIAVLVALNILGFFVNVVFADQMARDMKHARVEKKAAVMREKLEQLEQDGDYMGLYAYYYNQDCPYVSELDDFWQIAVVCGNYGNIYDAATKKYYYQNHSIPQDKELQELQVKIIEESLEDIYEAMDEEEANYFNLRAGCYTKEHVQAMEKCLEQTYAVLYTYCNIRKEDLEKFEELSSAKRSVIIEEGLSLNETEE